MFYMMVSAAPTATPLNPAPINVPVILKRDISAVEAVSLPVSSFSCEKSGIFADQETGCQVFHFCQEDGRMDSFFCPNLTLFNQKFFVCDWSYNVDCSTAHQFYHLNDALYLYTTPEQISAAIKPAIKITQVQPLEVSSSSGPSSSALLQSHSSSVTQLDALAASSGPAPAIVVENKIGVNDYSVSSSRNGKTFSVADSSFVTSLPPLPTYQPSLPTYQPSSSSLSSSVPVAQESVSDPYFDDASDPEPYISDDVADPEPSAYSSDTINVYNDIADADPEPAAYSSDSIRVYNDVADPEPASYTSDAISAVYNDDPADPEPAAYYDSADPEPYGNYPTYSGYNDASDPEPAPVAPVTTYNSDIYGQNQQLQQQSNVFYGDNTVDNFYDSVADPEPYNAPSYSQDNYVLPTYQSNVLVDYSDPEPSADPEFSPY